MKRYDETALDRQGFDVSPAVSAHFRFLENLLGAEGTLAFVAGGSGWRFVVLIFERAGFGLHLPSKFERIRDVMELILCTARAHHEDGSVIQKPSDQALLYPDALDLAEHRLDGMALNEADLDDDTLVGNAEFRCRLEDIDPRECRDCHSKSGDSEPPCLHRESSDGDGDK